MTDELKPCPFCGGQSIFVEPDERGSGGQWVSPIHVGCCACKCDQIGDSEADARAAWNRRAAPEAAEPADLWAVHIPGPDDLHAAPSNAEAIDAAAAHNAAWRPVHAAQVAKGNGWPPIECTLARVVPWPLDAEEHADSLKEWKLSDWIAPTDSQAGRDAVDARSQQFAERVRDGIAVFAADNWPDRKHSLAEIESGIRAIEVNASLLRDRLSTTAGRAE